MPSSSPEIHLSSIDTGLEDRFPGFEALDDAALRRSRHALAAHLVRFFFAGEHQQSRNRQGRRQPRGLSLETQSDAPAGAGISGSSALMIATTAALARYTGRALTLEQIREIAQNVEAQLIGVPTGCQDYFPASYGGVSAIHLDPDGLHREAIALSPAQLESRAVLVYTGVPRQSGINNWEVFKAHIDGNRQGAAQLPADCRNRAGHGRGFAGEAWEDVERLLREEWRLRKTIAPGISTPFIDRLIRIAGRNGGRAAKVCASRRRRLRVFSCRSRSAGACFASAGESRRESSSLSQWRPKGLEVCSETATAGVSGGAPLAGVIGVSRSGPPPPPPPPPPDMDIASQPPRGEYRA